MNIFTIPSLCPCPLSLLHQSHHCLLHLDHTLTITITTAPSLSQSPQHPHHHSHHSTLTITLSTAASPSPQHSQRHTHPETSPQHPPHHSHSSTLTITSTMSAHIIFKFSSLTFSIFSICMLYIVQNGRHQRSQAFKAHSIRRRQHK